jgi:hypothetical protein
MRPAHPTPAPWRVDVMDDTEKFNLPHGTLFQILGEINGYPSTVCVIEDYREVPGVEIDRAADAHHIACLHDLLAALQASTHMEHKPGENGPCLCSQCAFVRLRDAALAKFNAAPVRESGGWPT